jgi:iron complex outermembrane recepter protein
MRTSRAVSWAVGLIVAVYGRIGLPADAEVDKPPVEEVVVTGTAIKGISAETALPVQVLTAEDLQRTGATSVEQLFRQISAASSAGSVVAATATGTLTGSISTISLRGLRSARTLVLINGQRSSVYGGGSGGVAGNSVDTSSIPVAAIERVDILKDGASALYGSDAIGGVVNFVLKQNFTGLEVTGMGGGPTRSGGGTEEQASLFFGLGDLNSDRYNVNVGFSFNHLEPILGSSRSFATRLSPEVGNDVTSAFAFPANVALPVGGTRNPLAGNCGPFSLNDPNFKMQCRFDNSPFDSLQPEVTKKGFLLNGAYALNDDTQLFSTASFSRVTTQTQVQPVPLSFQNPLLDTNPYVEFLRNLLATQYPTYKNPAVRPGTGAFLLPPSSQYYPTEFAIANGQCTGAGTTLMCQPLNLIYRDFANGNRLTEDEADTLRLVGGIRGTALGWDYNSYLLYSTVEVKDTLKAGYGLSSLILPLLDSGRINPFGPTEDQSAIDEIRAAEFRGQAFATRTSLTSVNFNASRELFDVPAGPLAIGIGGELRRETFNYNPSIAVQTGDIAGIGGNQLRESASRSIESVYVEINAPIVQSLVADVAVRYDNYQTIGSTVNPKLSLRWQPTDRVLLRGSAGSGFRAPSLTDLNAPQARGVTPNGTRDPIQCPMFDANNPSCSFQFTTTTGGNPDLKPEKSTEYSLGAVLQPIKNATISVDSFWIYLKDQIVGGGLSFATILANAASANTFASFVTRDPVTNNIVSISQTNANLFKLELSGADLDLEYSFDVGPGRLTWHGNGTYFFKYDSQGPDGSYTSQLDTGLTVGGGVISRWRFNDTLSYDVGNWEFAVTQNYQKRYRDAVSSVTLAPRFVHHYETYDLQVSYTMQKNLSLTLGLINAFDKDPPYANYASTANNFIGGYDLTYGDPRGAFAYGRITYKL